MTRPGLLARLLRDRGGRIGLLAIAVLAFFAIFAEWIASDAPILARYQGRLYVLPALIEPARFDELRSDQIEARLGADDYAVWPLFRVGPTAITTQAPLSGVSARHILGTDAFGRDVFARLVHGTRASLALGAMVALLAVVVGFTLGGMAGALGGVWDGLVERFVEVVGVFPAVVAVALVRALERRPSLWSLVIVIAAVNGAAIARLTRALVLRCLAEEWAVAARASGASPARVAFVHVAPHLAGPLAIAATFALASVVLTETSLSFLDLGIPSRVASWGEMLGEVRWGAGARILLPPIVALGITVTALKLVADAVRKTFAA